MNLKIVSTTKTYILFTNYNPKYIVALLADRICKLNSNVNAQIRLTPNKKDKDILSRRSSPPVGALGVAIIDGQQTGNEYTCKYTMQCLVNYGFLKK